METKLAGSEKAATKSGGILDYFKTKCSCPTTPTASGDSVDDVSHIDVVSNFYDTQSLVSENISLGSSAASCGSIDHHHDWDGNGGPNIGCLDKLDTEARLAGRKRVIFRSGGLPKFLKSQCPLPISSVSSDSVANESSVPVINNFDDTCDSLSLGSAVSCASLDHLDGNGGTDSFS